MPVRQPATTCAILAYKRTDKGTYRGTHKDYLSVLVYVCICNMYTHTHTHARTHAHTHTYTHLPEVGDLGLPARIEENVAGFDVPVHPMYRAVQVRQPGDHLHRHI